MQFLALLGTHFLMKGVIFYIVKLTNSTAFNQIETLCHMLFEISNRSVTCVFYINIFIFKFLFYQQVLKQLAEVEVEARHFCED